MIRAISCTEEGRIALESDDLEDLKGPFDEGLAWRNASKKWETRIWYLPALRAMTPVDLKAPGLGGQLKAAIAALKHRPAPVDPSFAFTLPARGGYQLLGMGLVAGRTASMLADGVGLGKSFQSGVVLGRRCEDGGAGIIVTVLSATAQWMDEITSVYGAFEARQVILAVGTAKERRSAIAEWAKNPGGCVIITNHDTLRNDFSILRSAMEKVAKEVPTLTFIFDETGYIKNRTGSLFKASFQLGRYCTHRVALTATPIENTIGDLWAIMSWLRPAYMSRVGAFEKRHVKSFMIQPPYGPPYKKIIGYKHLDEITTAIRPFYLRRTQEDAGIKMPEIDTEMVALDMTAEQERIYGAIKDDWGEGRIDPKAALVRLRMVCASPALARREASHESPKLDWLFDRVKEEPGQIVVFTESRKFAQMAMERLRRFDPVLIAGGVSPLQRRHTQRAFMTGAVRVLIMTSAGERALNLQSAARLINLDFPWNPAKLQQRIGRIHRIGNPHERITVTNVVMRNSIESRVLATMVKKQRLSVAVIEGGEESVVKTLEISTATLKCLA